MSGPFLVVKPSYAVKHIIEKRPDWRVYAGEIAPSDHHLNICETRLPAVVCTCGRKIIEMIDEKGRRP